MLCRVVGNDAARRATGRAGGRRCGARIHEEFWVRETGFYALAIDGAGPAGSDDHVEPGASLVHRRRAARPRGAASSTCCMDDGMFNGWGVRTLARGQAVFNPLSYHNGSVWPHDNALVALGAARHERSDAALRILEGLYDGVAALSRAGACPSCSAGSVAARATSSCTTRCRARRRRGRRARSSCCCRRASAFAPDAAARCADHLRSPRLPAFCDQIDLAGLRVGNSRVSLHFDAARRAHALRRARRDRRSRCA